MLNKFAKLLLVLTSFSPVLLTYAVRYSTLGQPLKALLYITLGALSVCVCCIIIAEASKRLGRDKIRIASIKSADTEVLGFALAYLLPIVGGSSVESALR